MSAKKTSPRTARSKLDAVRDKVERLYGHRPNYTGADVGYRWTDGKKTDVLTVRVHVQRKLPVAEIDSAAVFPPEIDGVPLDVIEGHYSALPEAITRSAHFRARLPQLMGGMSCGRVDGGTGTAGLVVVDRKTGRPGVLSNWHVLAGPRARSGDTVLHPGLVDAPERAAQIATLERWMLDTDGDAAFAVFTPGQSWLPLQFGTFLPVTGARRSRLGETLVKSGRTTSVTEAQVDGEGRYRIRYETRPGITETRDIVGFILVPTDRTNDDNIEVSQGGDSGSAWLSRSDGQAVGLHFAGETDPDPRAEQAIACNMDTVLDRLDLDIADFDTWLEQIHQAEAAQAEYTPHPDGPDFPLPDWPWWPPRPWPFPRPWPGPVNPRPWPCPWLYGDMRSEDAGAEYRADLEKGLSPTRAIWQILREALLKRGFGWPGISIGTPVSAIAHGNPNVHAAVARVIRRTEQLPPVRSWQIEHCRTFHCICQVMVGLMQEAET